MLNKRNTGTDQALIPRNFRSTAGIYRKNYHVLYIYK